MDSEEDIDDVFVCRTGSSRIDAGFGGDDAPRTVMPTVISTHRWGRPGSTIRDEYVGDEAFHRVRYTSLQWPVEYGLVQDWEAMEAIWKHTFENELRVDVGEWTYTEVTKTAGQHLGCLLSLTLTPRCPSPGCAPHRVPDERQCATRAHHPIHV